MTDSVLGALLFSFSWNPYQMENAWNWPLSTAHQSLKHRQVRFWLWSFSLICQHIKGLVLVEMSHRKAGSQLLLSFLAHCSSNSWLQFFFFTRSLLLGQASCVLGKYNTRLYHTPLLLDCSGLWLDNKMQTFVSPLLPLDNAWHFLLRLHSPKSVKCGKCREKHGSVRLFLHCQEYGGGKVHFFQLKINSFQWLQQFLSTHNPHGKCSSKDWSPSGFWCVI